MRKLHVKKTMATNHQSSSTGTTGSGGGPRLSGIGSPTLGGGTPVKACKKVLPPAIPLEFLQRRNSQNLRKDDETPTNAEVILPQQQQQTTAIVHQQPEGQLIESLEDSALGYYATSSEIGAGMEHNVLLLNHQQAVYYHQQLAIDPGTVPQVTKLGPPPPPCRNSTVSVDSGRGASMLFVNGVPLPPIQQQTNSSVSSPAPSSGSSSSLSTNSSNKRNGVTGGGAGGVPGACYCGANNGTQCCCSSSLSSGSSSSSKMQGPTMIGPGGHPLAMTGAAGNGGGNRCSSISSCSLGSVDRISTSTSMKAAEEAEMISDWLFEINCQDYLNLFLAAGYDLPTIARMTFEDLTAIGVRTPHEREFLIQHIKQLRPPDNLPHYVPNSIREFLRILNMEEYTEKLVEQNFQSVRDICKLIWDDLEDIGIVKLGHQKKILLAIKRIKDILNGKFVATPTQTGGHQPGGSVGKNGSIGYFSISSQGSVSPSPPMNSAITPTPMFNYQVQDLPPCACDNSGMCPTCQLVATLGSSGGGGVILPSGAVGGVSMCHSEFENEIVPIQLQMRHRPQKGAEMITTIPESEIVSCGGFIPTGTVEQQQLQLQHQHSLANVHQWATAAAMNRKSLDDVDLALAKQQLGHQGGYFMGSRQSLQQQQQQQQHQHQQLLEEGAAYYYGKAGGAAAAMMLSGSGNGGGTLPRNFGGLIKEDKVRPVAKVQAQVVMRQQQQAPSPPLKDTPAYVMAQQQHVQVQQPVYVNFGHLNNHVHHHHFYGGDVSQQNTIALTALQQQQTIMTNNPSNNNSAIMVNTQAEVHHHQGLDTPAVPHAGMSAHHKNDIKSNTSLDSIDQIPFANENAGTIKQRGGPPNVPAAYYQHHLGATTSTAAQQMQQQQHQQQQQMQRHRQRTQSGGADSSAGSDELAELDRMESLRIEDDDDDIRVGGSASGSQQKQQQQQLQPSAMAPSDINANVLNDIGNMLANLTDELDAMLEEEKRAGLNDD